MAATDKMIVKMNLGDDIRRFTANRMTFNWAAAAKRATEAFEFSAVKKFRMTYKDDEGDVVTLSSDEELSEAVGLALLSTPSVLRMTVHPLDKAEEKSSGADTKAADDMASFIDSISKQLPPMLAKQLPVLAEQLPAAMRNMMGGDGFVRPHHTGTKEGVHKGVSCDKSGMAPIVGNRYNLVGRNYDLCEAEFEKLGDDEKALFTEIPPPTAETAKVPAGEMYDMYDRGFHPGIQCDRSGMTPIFGVRYDAIPPAITMPWAGGPWCAAGRGAGGPCRGGWGRGGPFGKGMGGGKGGGKGKGHGGGKGHTGEGDKLTARFICDVGFFDGTQVAPNTKFTKIWRIKNCGEVPWPGGTRMLFVGGDQMTTEMSVPIGRDALVMPGEEVDVAVEMTAPNELGRYLGYWRLTGPRCHRKWGQRVWCHVQVVDPSQPANAVDVDSAVAELEKMKSNLPAEDAEEEVADEAAVAGVACTSMASKGDSGDGDVPMAEGTPMTTLTSEPVATQPTDKPLAEPAVDASDEAVLVTDKMVVEAQPSAPEEPLSSASRVKAALKAMGFLDDTMIDAVVAKHGEDLDACATDLAKVSEWDSLLSDLTEMGFENRELNKTLMLKHGGNIKRTVKALVEA